VFYCEPSVQLVRAATITLINLEQAKLEEVFLPYLVMPSNKNLFETMEHNQFLLPDKSAA
jgi:hypothetical protein